MICLYQRTDCPFCWKVRIALAELKLDYEVVEISFGVKHPVLSHRSPSGTVPVLVDGDLAVWESGVILEYLEGRYSPGQLFSTDPVVQVRTRLMHAYSDRLAGASLRDVVFEKRSKREADLDENVIRMGTQKWLECLAYLDAQLGREIWFGQEFSAADCALAARFGVAEAYGLHGAEQFPGLYRWFQAVQARASWAAAYPQSFIRPR